MEDAPVLLRELGITKNDSSRSQRIATLSDEVFERYLAENASANREPSTAALLRLQRQEDTSATLDIKTGTASNIVADLKTLVQAGRRFSAIYAEPPWPYTSRKDYVEGNKLAAIPTSDATSTQIQSCPQNAPKKARDTKKGLTPNVNLRPTRQIG